MTDIKEGQRVRISFEGQVESMGPIGTGIYHYGEVSLDSGETIYFEHLPSSVVEIIKAPLTDGLYYYTGAGEGQMSGVYKLEDGMWYDRLLNPFQADDLFLDLVVPLVAGER